MTLTKAKSNKIGYLNKQTAAGSGTGRKIAKWTDRQTYIYIYIA